MKKFLLSLCYILFIASPAAAQSLDVFSIDTTQFPLIRASFRAFDAQGIEIRDRTPQDFTITENGIVRKVLTVTCPEIPPPLALSSVLTMDVSGSMSSGQGIVSNLELAKTAARAWINGLPGGASECAITAFDNANYFIQDFTSNKQKLRDALQKLSPDGGTDYDVGFLRSFAGGLEVIKEAKHKRILIFLSDGLPNLAPDEAAIIAKAKALNVTIFCVTLGLPMPKSLKNIAEGTQGEWFENVTTTQQAEDTYRKILRASVGAKPCQIEWQSEAACSPLRQVSLTMPLIATVSQTQYFAPQRSVINVQLTPETIISFGEVPPGSYKDTNIVLTVRNSSVRITNITFSTPTLSIVNHGGTAPPFILNDGESRTLRVRCQPTDSLRVYGRVIIENEQCAPVHIFTSSGFRGKKVQNPQLKVIHPNGAEEFLAGSDTTIRWEGLPAQNAVRLDYSLDKGLSWFPLTENARGLHHTWRVPNITSDNCLVKVSSFARDNDRPDWGRLTDGSEGAWYADGVRDIAVDEAGYSYVLGSLSSTHIDFGNGNVVIGPNNGRDYVFLAKFGPDGKSVWAKGITGKSSYNDMNPSAIAVDTAGNVYVVGTFNYAVTFENGLTLTNTSTSSGIQLNPTDSFLACFDENGMIIWAKAVGGAKYDNINSFAIDSKGAITIGGTFNSDTLKLSNNTFLTNSFLKGGSTGTYDGFLVKYHPDGTVRWAKAIGGNDEQVVQVLTTDDSDNIYVSGYYTSDLDFGDGIIVAHTTQGNSGFFAKYGENGDLQWGKKAGKSENDRITMMEANTGGSIFFGGYFSKSPFMDFGNGITVPKGSGADPTGFLGKLSSDGTIEWVRPAPGITSIATDNFGNVCMGGTFRDSINFGNGVVVGVPVPNAGYGKGYVARYDDVGRAQLAKKITGGVSAYVGAIDCDDKGDIYLAGGLSGNMIDFHNGTTLTTSHSYSLYIAKYSVGGEVDLSDTSDAVFSIVKPVANAHNIDMGKVFVGDTKDSLIVKFIRNTTSYPIRIDTIVIKGADASEFQLVSGIPPFIIPADESKSLEFRFQPKAEGVRIADLEIGTQVDPLLQTITGEGIHPRVAIASTMIDFGLKEVGSIKDTVVTAVITNIGDVPLHITESRMLGPDKEQFTILAGSGSLLLGIGGQHTMQLRFSPQYIGRTSGQIGFYYEGMTDRPSVVQLFGHGIGGTAYIVDDSAYVGQTRNIKLKLGKVEPVSIAQTSATSFRTTIAYANSILTPKIDAQAGSFIHQGNTIDTITITQQWNAQSNELASVPIIATLGDRLSTDLELLEFSWLDEKGERVDYATELQSGTFTVLGICPEGGERLFDIHGKELMMMVTPNPVNDGSEVTFTTIEKGRTIITLTDVLGRQVEVTNKEYSVGEHSLPLPTNELPSGVYILTMKTPTQVRTLHVMIGK